MADNKGGAMMRKKIFPEYEPELTIGELKIDPMSYSVIYQGASVALTSKEFEVLYLLAQRPKFIFPKRIIYTAVWGEDSSNIPYQTVENTIWKIRKKMGYDIIRTKIAVGYGLGIEDIE